MKTKVISINLIIIMLIPIMISCKKDELKEPQSTRGASHIESVDRIWPWVVGATVIGIIGKLAEGQATDVTYHENGNLAGYSCTGIGTCHISSMSGGSDEVPFSSFEPLYEGDQYFRDFELVKTRDGKILFGTNMDNPSRRVVFNNGNILNLSVPFIIDNPDVLSILGISEPIEIRGEYVVYTNESRGPGVQYIQLN